MDFYEKIMLTDVPAEDQPFVMLLRRHLQDTAELNTLEGVQENTDLDLYRALLFTLNEINFDITPITNYQNFRDIPSIKLLFTGATLQILKEKGILSARNTITYQDAGGVTVQDYDKYGRYVNWFNVLTTAYYTSVRAWKMASNAESCYGGVGSEYSFGTMFSGE